jgi:hypothetical protein
VPLAELGDFLETRRKLCQLAAPAQALDCSQLVVRGSARPHEVRVVGIRQAVGPRARGGHNCALFEQQDGPACAGERERVGDRLDSLGVGDGVAAAIEYAESHSFLLGDTCDELCAFDAGGAQLEVRRAWAAQRTAAEQRAADVRGAAAGARNDPARRTLEGRQPRGEDSRFVKHL